MAGSQCCENPPALSSSSGHGTVVESFGGLKSYIAGSANSKAAILLVSDVFGFEAPNLRKLADKTAATGFFVVVPDFFNGDYYDPDKIPIATWIVNHSPDKGFEDAKTVVTALRSKGFTAVGASGFCWGAKVVAELAKSAEIKAGVMLHPSLVTVDDIKANKSHLAILGAEIDKMSPPELVRQFEEILSSNAEVDSFVKIFSGVAHGWTVRYDVSDAAAVEKAEESHRDMIGWFVKHLH
ncbi:Endo-1,3(4)-beta-D-glucanase [Apostasia shenzhenica]|uniref:Endo-1,3(4)-beta-D-glucanase n=1 Tax=Apostasia shenzhenica TaxID=1088818 RepID=A0A2I0A4I7_9ASPA|nr:Endo-1,3(4)-beta-D-glucanase [Apostasia shenzhenica]